jgi:hypothetical protein
VPLRRRCRIPLPNSLVEHRETLQRLADAYKAINAPRGTLGRASLMLSTHAIADDDASYGAYLSAMQTLIAQRNTIAGAMIEMLEGAAFADQPIDEAQAQSLTAAAHRLLNSIPSD